MPNLSVSNKLVPALTGGAVADAINIAYSTKTEGSGYTQREVIDKSVKDMIDLILASGGDSMYDENTTVREKLMELVDSGHYAQEYAEDAEAAALVAEDAKNDIISRQSAINLTATTTVNTIENKKLEVIALFTDQITQLNNIHSAVNEFRDSFDADRQFQIMSESVYESLLSKDAGTIYFLYDDNG